LIFWKLKDLIPNLCFEELQIMLEGFNNVRIALDANLTLYTLSKTDHMAEFESHEDLTASAIGFDSISPSLEKVSHMKKSNLQGFLQRRRIPNEYARPSRLSRRGTMTIHPRFLPEFTRSCTISDRLETPTRWRIAGNDRTVR
jgi:hypothetical protein